MKVALNGRRGGDRFAVTDAAGRFAGRILRDETQPFGWAIRDPLPFYEPVDFPEPPQRMPRPGVFELDLPSIALRRGADVRGTVTGEDGRPVAGAMVEASWHDSRELDQSALARTDRTGGFVLHGISPLAELDLNASDGFAAATTTVRAATAADRPIALTLSPKDTVPIGGRVVDPDGRPIAGASVSSAAQAGARTRASSWTSRSPPQTGRSSSTPAPTALSRTRPVPGPGRVLRRGDLRRDGSPPGRLRSRRAPGFPIDPTVLVLRLHPGPSKAGSLTASGRPVAGAIVPVGRRPDATDALPTTMAGSACPASSRARR